MTTAVQTQSQGRAAVGTVQKTVKQWITGDYFRQQVALVLPKHLTPERFVRIALSALNRVPKLAKCTPDSVIKCMMQCSELGLEPDGRRYHLIPFENRKTGQTECQGIIDYKGLVELAMNSGNVSSVFAEIVCDNDEFTWDTGEVHHKIDWRKNRGSMYAVYTVIQFKDGGKHTETMTKQDVDRIRSRSRAANNGPWVTDYDEMAKKTVFRRASKWVKLSPEVQDALDAEDTPPDRSLVGDVASAPAGLLEDPPEEPAAINVPAETQPAPEPNAKPDPKQPQPEPAPPNPAGTAPEPPEPPKLLTNQNKLAEIVTGGGFTFAHFNTWAQETGNLPKDDAIKSFSDVPDNIAERLARAKAGLLKGLAVVKAAQEGVTP